MVVSGGEQHSFASNLASLAGVEMNHEVRFMIRLPGREPWGKLSFLRKHEDSFFFQNGNPVLSFAKNWWGLGGGGCYCLSFKKTKEKRPRSRAIT